MKMNEEISRNHQHLKSFLNKHFKMAALDGYFQPQKSITIKDQSHSVPFRPIDLANRKTLKQTMSITVIASRA